MGSFVELLHATGDDGVAVLGAVDQEGHETGATVPQVLQHELLHQGPTSVKREYRHPDVSLHRRRARRRPLNHLTLQRVPEPKRVKNRPEGATGAELIFAQMTDPEGHELCAVARPSRQG